MKYKVLVCSGGGTKCILQVGAEQQLYDNNEVEFDTYIGSSAGALMLRLDMCQKRCMNL